MSVTRKRLAVLGSTGSIGRQALDVVRALPEHFRVVALAAGKNLELLAAQVKEFRPEFIGFGAGSGLEEKASEIRDYSGCEFLPLEEMARLPAADIVILATSGTAGLGAFMAAVKAGKNIALANKESLVSAGHIITAEAARTGARLLPVDSEHSAIWQCLAGERQPPRRIVLTASGGPFREYSPAAMSGITVAQALAHPSWKMGKKVTIDSATLMNKGMEVIEARWLFGVPMENVRVLVHPRSIVHSFVEFIDGSVKAQLGCPDMRLPIQYALSYPERLDNPALPRLDWNEFRGLTFEPPDMKKFPCLRLAVEAGKKGGTYPAVLCAADEAAVGLFLEERIKFTDIPRLIELVLERHGSTAIPGLEEIAGAEEMAWKTVMASVGGVA
jgi:1-deoxy-D-xylulose-5-phosphate reductoisomerase